MRKVIWLLAVLMTLGIAINYLNVQGAIKDCLEQQGNYNYQTDFCSFKEVYQGSTSYIANHLPLFLMWLFSLIAAALSLIVGIVKTPVEYEESLKKKVKGFDLSNQEKSIKKLLMIDNYDSFTYNLIQYFGEIGLESKNAFALELIVKRNDEISLDRIKTINPDYIVISPGPCTPDESGISLEIIEQYAGVKPILGVCLGHQAMAQVYGGEVIKAETVMHGKTSDIFHIEKGVFRNLPNPFKATRYHSLIVKAESLPEEFEVTAWTQDENGELEYVMGIKHKEHEMEGVQFHPESILSEHGHQILRNFLKY